MSVCGTKCFLVILKFDYGLLFALWFVLDLRVQPEIKTLLGCLQKLTLCLSFSLFWAVFIRALQMQIEIHTLSDERA